MKKTPDVDSGDMAAPIIIPINNILPLLRLLLNLLFSLISLLKKKIEKLTTTFKFLILFLEKKLSHKKALEKLTYQSFSTVNGTPCWHKNKTVDENHPNLKNILMYRSPTKNNVILLDSLMSIRFGLAI
jgi:hypothetical protein